MPDNENRLSNLLDQRFAQSSYRSLTLEDNRLIDFSSNDYLGLAHSAKLKQQIISSYNSYTTKNGSTGSRLLTGSSTLIQETESFLSSLFGGDNGLLFSSGYMANLAFFSTVPQKGDTVLYDELSHACIKDGLRLSLTHRFPFRHNDLGHLEEKLKRASGEKYIVCESVYSMDGDVAPLKEIAALAETYQAKLVVDEAHSTGAYGENGNGLINALGLREQVYAVIYTFGKAMGLHGAFISGTDILRQFLINFARPFIYTTAPADFECLSLRGSFQFLAANTSLQQQLQERINLFKKNAGDRLPLIPSNSAIQAVMVPGNEKAKQASHKLKASGFDVRPILSPTVRATEERLRICLHSYNSREEIEQLTQALISCLSTRD